MKKTKLTKLQSKFTNRMSNTVKQIDYLYKDSSSQFVQINLLIEKSGDVLFQNEIKDRYNLLRKQKYIELELENE